MTTSHGNILEKGSRLKRLLAISATALIASVALATPAWAGAGGDRRIEVNYSIDYVLVEGYPQAGQRVQIDVFRNADATANSGVKIGSFQGTTSPDPQQRSGNIMEVNHIGGGQFPDGDCWQEPFTPNIQPGDKVQATILDGTNAGNVDYTFVRNLDFVDENGSFTGTATGVESNGVFDVDAPIVVGDAEAGGASISAKRIGGTVDAEQAVVPNPTTGAFSVPIAGSGGETFVEFLNPNADGGAGDEATVAEPRGTLGEGGVGCPPLADYEIINSNPEKINKAFELGTANLDISGVSAGASSISITLDDADQDPNDVVNATNVQISPNTDATSAQSWTASFDRAGVLGLNDGNLTATATYTTPNGALTSTKTIVKDTLPPQNVGAVDLTTDSGDGQTGSGTDDRTNDNTPSFSGTAEAGSTVEIFDGTTSLGNASFGAGDSWSFTVPQDKALVDGNHSIKAVVTDGAGNTTESAVLSIAIDTLKPRVNATPGGTFNSMPTVSLSLFNAAQEAGTRIFYTRDNTTPSDTATLYASPFAMSGTLKYVAIDRAGNSSDVGTQVYSVRAATSTSLVLNTKAIKLRGTKVISGTVSPANSGNVVRMTIRRPGPDLVRNLPLVNGRYSFTYRATVVGIHRVSVSFAQDADSQASTSRTGSFRVIR